MRDKDVIGRIKALCRERGWTYYRLSKQANIPYSTLNNMLHRSNIPTISTVQKICDGLEISLSDFFSDGCGDLRLSKSQNEILELFTGLKHSDKQLLMAYAMGLNHRNEKI